MKTKISPAVVGLFVLGALILAMIALLSFGGVNFFSKRQQFKVYFDESIHGLDLGSPVKLRGVRVGYVVDLKVRYDAKENKSEVAVICELSRNVVLDERGMKIDVSSRDQLQKLVDRGMRAKLDLLGLATGLLFVELDFVDPATYPPTAIEKSEPGYAVIPAIPSTIAEFQASLTDILSNLRKVDFAGLSVEIKNLLTDTRKQVNGLNLAGLNTEWTKAGQSVSALASSAEVRQTFVNLNAAINQLTATLAKIDAQVQPAGAKLGDTLVEAQNALKSFNAAAEAARQFISAQTGLGDETTRALSQLSEAAAAVQRLADFLERNPNALLTGKKPPR
jgi:paraquat-inducible protein B